METEEYTTVIAPTQRGRKTKIVNVHPNNEHYYTDFLASLNPATANQYRVTIAPFVEGLGQKGVASVTVQELETVCTSGKNDGKNKSTRVHLTCFYKWAVKNVEGFAGKVSRDVLVWLI